MIISETRLRTVIRNALLEEKKLSSDALTALETIRKSLEPKTQELEQLKSHYIQVYNKSTGEQKKAADKVYSALGLLIQLVVLPERFPDMAKLNKVFSGLRYIQKAGGDPDKSKKVVSLIGISKKLDPIFNPQQPDDDSGKQLKRKRRSRRSSAKTPKGVKMTDHIKDKKSGNAFRAWANKNYSKLTKAKRNTRVDFNGKKVRGLDLDPAGSHRNSYIRAAWSLLGDLYLAKEKSKPDNQAAEPDVSKAVESAKNAENHIDRAAAIEELANQTIKNPASEVAYTFVKLLINAKKKDKKAYEIAIQSDAVKKAIKRYKTQSA